MARNPYAGEIEKTCIDTIFLSASHFVLSICLPETPCDTPFAIAERLREKIAAMALPDPLQNLSLAVSFGAAENDQGNKSLDELISAADKHLYQAKDAGHNQVCDGLLSEV